MAALLSPSTKGLHNMRIQRIRVFKVQFNVSKYVTVEQQKCYVCKL